MFTKDEVLRIYRKRAARYDWTNVELIQAEAARFEFPPNLGGVLSTFAITLVPEYDEVIRHAARALSPGKRIVVLDFKLPERAPDWLVDLGVWIMRPFAVTRDLAVRHPWESVLRHASRRLDERALLGLCLHRGRGGAGSLPVLKDTRS